MISNAREKGKRGTVLLQYFPSGAQKVLIEHTTKQFIEKTRDLPQKKVGENLFEGIQTGDFTDL